MWLVPNSLDTVITSHTGPLIFPHVPLQHIDSLPDFFGGGSRFHLNVGWDHGKKCREELGCITPELRQRRCKDLTRELSVGSVSE